MMCIHFQLKKNSTYPHFPVLSKTARFLHLCNYTDAPTAQNTLIRAPPNTTQSTYNKQPIFWNFAR